MKKKEKVILLQNSELGKKYEVVELGRGFVLNYLLPKNKIVFYNQQNIALIERQKISDAKKNLILEEQAHDLCKKLDNVTLDFTLKKDEKGEVFGSVGFKEILQELAKLDFQIEKNQLLDFHPLNKVGENLVKIKLSSNVIADLKIIVN